MIECQGNKFILNGKLYPAESFDNALVYQGDSIYEVIRMEKGRPLFFTDHMDRLCASAKLRQKELLADAAELRKCIINLMRSGRKGETNVKIVFNYNKGSNNFLVYNIEPIYPTIEQYRNGVKGILYYAEREDPESKVINHKLRSAIYNKLILESGYEALLVNEDNYITEGSRSNIFFIKGDSLITAPDNVILNGITRKHLLEICKENKINVGLECINADKISEFDSVFMTGTSPIVLPFNCIGNVVFNVRHPFIERLRNLYLRKAEESISAFRSE
jgi:branched-chain amino acid aminotransferase